MHAAAKADGLSDAEMKAKFYDVTGEDFDDFCDMDLPNYIYGEDVPVESPYFQHSACNFAKTQLYDDPFFGSMSANFDDADYASRLYAHAKKSERYSPLYETLARLCDVMEKKLLLAKKTRALHSARDTAGLKALAENDYSQCIERINLFYAAFKNQWYHINKTYGFEVQDARLGGLVRRLESCRERILGFVSGEIGSIAELDEEILPMDDTYITSWGEMISSNNV